MNLRKSKKSDLLVDLTPLIDVVFLMLIFFMVSTSFKVTADVKLDLPDSQHAEKENQQPSDLVISINSEGEFFIQGDQVQVENLEKTLLKASGENKNTRVVLQADAQARHKQVVLVLDTLQALGMTKVGIATMPVGE
ncbi:MAG: biopolymer transporter ExbD [Zetaproteobacteria bacterium]|nr:biopolymer transporter ExbD [Zetaproteobacteria bacterium]